MKRAGHDERSTKNDQTTGRGDLILDDQLCFALYSTMHAIGKCYGPLLADLHLTYPQYLVMLVLWEGDAIGVKAIGARLHLDSGTLTPLLKRLETAGLVKRSRKADDERHVTVALTDDGRALRERAMSVPVGMGAAMGRTPDQIAALKDDVLRLRASLLGAPAS